MAVLDEMENGVHETSSATPSSTQPNSSSGPSNDKIHTYNLLLSQAIKANDWSEINSVMRTIWTDGGGTAKRVVRGLNVVDVVPLLRITAVVMREERLKEMHVIISSVLIRGCFSPNHILLTNNWVRFTTQILQNQSAYLSMLENLDEELNDLLDYVRRRSSQMQELMQLEGKIAWILERAEERKQPIRYAEQEAEVVFDDSDDKDEAELMDEVDAETKKPTSK